MNPSDEITFFCPVSETDITQPICDAIVQGIEHNDFACGKFLRRRKLIRRNVSAAPAALLWRAITPASTKPLFLL